MANHSSAIKRARQSEKKRIMNKGNRTRTRNLVKAVNTAVAEKSADKAKETLAEAVPVIYKAASKGTFHKKTSARKVSRLMKKVNALQRSMQSGA